MFWGIAIKDGKPFKTNVALEENEYPVLHISNVAIPKNAPNGKYYLLASFGKDVKDLTLASLNKERNDV